MELKEIEQAAIKQLGMPHGLTAPDKFVFLALRNIYAYYQLGRLSKEEGSREKQRVLRDYTELQKKYIALVTTQAEMIKRSEMLRAQINKATSKDDMLAAAIECISLMTGDKNFMGNIGKIKKINTEGG